jgi:plastocyanin
MKAARRISLIAALTVGLVAIGSSAKIFAATPDEKSPSEAAVKIDNFSFSPATITVPAGTTIRWTNRDDIPHTVVSDEKTFKSKVLDTDQEFIFTFSKPGTYSYFCSIHPHMTGKVVVQ